MLAPLAALLLLVACDKKENRLILESADNPVLTASTQAVELSPGKEQETALVLNWTNPEYRFNTGVSSHDVRYTVEFDLAGANFRGPNRAVATSVLSELGVRFTVNDLNALMGNVMRLAAGTQYNIEARVLASLGQSNGAQRISNTITFSATPFDPPPAVDTPSTGRLVLVGSASPGGWDNSPTNPQVFERKSATLYELVIQLNGGESCLFLPVAGSWDDKYGWAGSNNTNNPNGDKLRRGGGDIRVPAESALYRITVDFQEGVFTIVKQ